ncbi:MAG: polysaccharide pyruvyl transferase family protein [Lachnospiraceae bacterium]
MDNKNEIINIITWCDADNIVNYGQVLQGCAIGKIISELNVGQVTLLSYRKRNFWNICKYYLIHFNPFSKNRNMYSETRKFVNKIMKEESIDFKQVFTRNQVEKSTQKATVLLCGSDQIWHPMEFDPILLLGVKNRKAKRIAYAASEPMGKVYSEHRNIYKKMGKYLKHFDKISIREKGTVPLIESLSGLHVENVVDPTLLVTREEWNRMIVPMNLKEKYVLLYIPADMNSLAQKIVTKIRKETGIKKIICIAPRITAKLSHVDQYNNIGVGKFLYLVKNAEFICTSSFHGVIFSIIFEKQFWCFKWFFTDRRSDLRLEQITEMAGLEDRLIKSEKEIDIKKEIEYEACKKKMSKEIEKSFEFLHAAFEEKSLYNH